METPQSAERERTARWQTRPRPRKAASPALLTLTSALLLGLIALPASEARTCTRAVYHGEGGLVLTGRTMDWSEEVGTNLWVFPRGMERTGEAGRRSVRWTSRYGSVVASGYDIATTDGLNERGLVANLLWLAESRYPQARGNRATLSLSLWAQYVLDNFATVSEAVEALRAESFVVVTDAVPGQGRLATLHLSVSDAAGDSAIFEYIDEQLVIHHGRQHQVMTNSPVYDQQLALAAYWEQIGGTVMLPGTNRAADRFVRASFYVNAIPRFSDPAMAVPAVMSVMRNVSVPYGISTPGHPNISTTRWRVVVDHTNLVYHFESALAAGTIHVRLRDLDLSPGTPVRRLELDRYLSRAGDVTGEFRPAAPMRFLPATN